VGEPEYEVAAVLHSRKRGRRIEYLIEWAGYDNDPDQRIWEPPSNVENCKKLIEAFHRAYPDKPTPYQNFRFSSILPL
jgi:hypothetical protein